MRVTFWVPGVPAPKGSTRAFMRPGARFPIVTTANAKTKPWEQAIRTEASQAGCTPSFQGPVRIEATFMFPRPKGHFGAKGVKASAPRTNTKKPDLDKLARTLLDALSGVAFVDDAQVTELRVIKRYVPDVAGFPGMNVVIEDAEGHAHQRLTDAEAEKLLGQIDEAES